ncbi:ribosome hibernation-promoting factor, HPF/YfiA family [Aureliella helgolandensis]|uniref:Ribosome hibernation promoting factor n=1 Tax=Aureliella helgolandensis TaxID=2527968 RepID=A0A518G694_9BACT|nr:ribosome-associated translation inhibitor RaiA [Aureliella helgolandensis]QDV24084.1 Ribosome hibernation promoting factor [Aureliella helgolandensis]
MQVNVSARHGSLSTHDQEVIREKAEKVRRLFDRVNAVQVTVDMQHQESPHVEINVSAEHAPDFVASAEATTVLSALDGALAKVEQQLRKFKEKTTGHKSTGVKHITPVAEPE